MTFPFDWEKKGLLADDLCQLQARFAAEVREEVPCETVHFLPLTAIAKQEVEVPEAWAASLAKVCREQRPAVQDKDGLLFLPLWSDDEFFAVAVLGSVAREWLADGPADWLLAKSRQISRKLRLAKEWAYDPVTGLLNGRQFHDELHSLVQQIATGSEGPASGENDGRHATLVLLEVYPRVRDAEHALQSIAKASAYLDSLIGHYSPLYHFGSGIFGMIWEGADVDQALEMAEAVLRWLKREDFVQVHIGITAVAAEAVTDESMGPGGLEPAGKNRTDRLLDQAWQALGVARKRGPYALCTYESLHSLEQQFHPALPSAIVNKLQGLARRETRFALLLLRRDRADAAAEAVFSQRVRALIGPQQAALLVNDQEVFVFLAGAGQIEAREWAAAFQAKVGEVAALSFSIGIALYPCQGFNKSDMPVNARKALLHTRFYGPATATVFDGVSLNISGDAYYNAGDLLQAAREYRRALALDSGNINVLNSLGVTYAQMNRYKMAVEYFEKVLILDPVDFMALFNLGFAYLAQGKRNKAVASFEAALAVDCDQFDLLLQLGRLYCQAGRYAEAVTVLDKAAAMEMDERPDMLQGALKRYLGEAYKELGRSDLAMTHLQRAISHNPRDAGSLSLLGELYSREKQGNDIALSLCRQAVQLDDSRWEHWRRLALVQQHQGNLAAAVVSLKKAVRLDRGNSGLAYQLGRLLEKNGKIAQARRMYEKILRQEPGHTPSKAALATLQSL